MFGVRTIFKARLIYKDDQRNPRPNPKQPYAVHRFENFEQDQPGFDRIDPTVAVAILR